MSEHRYEMPPMISRRDFLKLSAAAGGSALLAGMGGWAYASQIEPDWIDITHPRLTIPGLDPALRGFRLVQISDIHMDEWMNGERLLEMVARINRLEPEAVAITGDFITEHPGLYEEAMIQALSALQAAEGVFAVLGNHDYWVGSEAIRRILERSGVRELRNQVHPICRGGACLQIAGIDDFWEGQARLDEVLEALDRSSPAVLLAHEPDFADISAASGRFALQISGHSHGGQIVLPGGYAPVLPPYGQKYPGGLYQVREMLQYTNRGLGMIAPHLRLNCRPEITLFQLS